MATKKEIKKVIASIREVSVPEYEARYSCPYCKWLNYENDIDEENITVTGKCQHCKESFKVKIPKFY